MRGTVRARTGAAIAAVVGVLLTLTLVAGCGPVPPGRAAQARAATSGPTGPMTFQLPNAPTAVDPFAAPGSADQLLAAVQFQPLVTTADSRIDPAMATWWASIDQGTRHIVNVRRDLWSDGARMGSYDLIFTLEQHLRPGSRSALLPTLLHIAGAREFHEGRARHVAGLTADTSRTTVITLTEPDANFVGRLGGVLVLPRHVYADQDLTRPEAFREPAVGSGTYLFDSWQGADQVTFHPNPDVKPFARLDKLIARFVAPDQVTAALQRGDLDVAVAVPPAALNELPPGYRGIRAPGNTLVGLSGRGPLAEVRVRQALAYAIDREAILASQLGGNGRVVDSVLFTPDWAAAPQRARHPHDPQRARTLLTEAGWRDGQELRLAVLTDNTDTAVWDAVSDDLAEVGVRATFAVHPLADRAAVWADPAIDGVVETYRLPFGDPAQIEPWVTCGVPSGFCDPELDALLAAGRSESVATDRQRTYWQADRLLSEQLPVIPLWVPDAAVVVVNGRTVSNPLLQPATAMIDQWGAA